MALTLDQVTRGKGFVKGLTKAFEALGLLNRGSSESPSVPGPDEVNQVQPISSNALNVTRVGGVTAFASSAVGALIVAFRVHPDTQPRVIVAAAYGGIGLIVAAALVAIAVIIAADIRARTAIATATSAPQPQAAVKLVEGSATPNVAIDTPYEYVLVDAEAGSVDLTIPSAATCAWRWISFRRTDADAAGLHRVQLVGVEGIGTLLVAPGAERRLYSNGKTWNAL